ncbi:MAG: EF-Tu/IF-2/RF-3 family GTPase, partial [Terriglobales bacterium]
IYDLFIDLDASEDQLDFPVIYTNAKTGVAQKTAEEAGSDLAPLFEAIVAAVPAPTGERSAPLQLQVLNLDYSDYLGRIAIGRVFNGCLTTGADVAIAKLDGALVRTRITRVYTFNGLKREETAEAGPGEIVALAGVEGIQIGETVTDAERPSPLPPVLIDEPTLAMIFTVNTSPLAGRDGSLVTSRHLRERLERELLTNVSIRVDEQSADTFRVLGRGELQLAILIEGMRREGYELMAGKPEIVCKQENGQTMEPQEQVVVDCPTAYVGVVIERLGARRGEMTQMADHGSGRVRLEFLIPARGLIGLRGALLQETRGTALMHSIFAGWVPYRGELPARPTGALVADRAGTSTAYALNNLQERGQLFLGPGVEVYEGMIVGESAREDDMDVNPTKEKKLTNMRASVADEAIRLVPFHAPTLEQALEFVAEDEWVEVTPHSLRLRKKILASNRR